MLLQPKPQRLLKRLSAESLSLAIPGNAKRRSINNASKHLFNSLGRKVKLRSFSLANKDREPPRVSKVSPGPDPFRWLEDIESPEVLEYIQEENGYTAHVMEKLSEQRRSLYAEMRTLDPHDGQSLPERYGDYWYYSRRAKRRHNFPTYYRKPVAEGGWDGSNSRSVQEEVVLDQNSLPFSYKQKDLGNLKVSLSKKGEGSRCVAFTLRDPASGTSTLYVREIRGGGLWEVHVGVVGFEWGQGDMLYYTTADSLGRPSKVWKVKGWGGRELIWHESDERFFVDVNRTKDGEYVVVNINSKMTSEAHIISQGGGMKRVRKRVEGVEYFLEHIGNGGFIIITNEGGPTRDYVLKAWDGEEEGEWRPFLEKDHSLEFCATADIDVFQDFCVLYQRVPKGQRIRVLKVEKEPGHGTVKFSNACDIPLPEKLVECGVIRPGLNQWFWNETVRFSVTNPVVPEVVYDYNMRTLELTEKRRVGVEGAEAFVCQKIYAKSKDEGAGQVEIPITVVHSKDNTGNDPRPLVLYGYGAYGVSLALDFQVDYIPLLKRGWILAFAHVRGGGEGGKEWYREGAREKKRRSIEDYTACAGELIAKGWTRAGWVAGNGSSAGALLIAAALNQNPELFGALVLRFPFLDLVNTMLNPKLPLTVHEYEEWGDPRDEKVLASLRSISPYENIPHGKPLPPALVLASLMDDRVRYSDAVKWVAKVRHVHKDRSHHVLLDVTSDYGHSGPMSRREQLELSALEKAFLLEAIPFPSSPIQ